MLDLLLPLTAYHWLGLGLVLLGLEATVGTFDLLWISVAAFATGLFAAITPSTAFGWEVQLLIFALTAGFLVVLGRTVFAGLRRAVRPHPTLNRRMVSLVGRRGVAAVDFTGGVGRVKIGDTEWGAETADGGGVIRSGDPVVVEATRSTTVLVRRAST